MKAVTDTVSNVIRYRAASADVCPIGTPQIGSCFDRYKHDLKKLAEKFQAQEDQLHSDWKI
jgi:hypothetical protein